MPLRAQERREWLFLPYKHEKTLGVGHLPDRIH
jgi:hypothetical protein